jgi:hypothetical protein
VSTTPAIEDAAPNATVIKIGVNPVLKVLFRTPLKRPLGRQLTLLRFTGRRSGRRYDFPVGLLEVRGGQAITSRRGWKANFAGGLGCEAVLDGRWTQAKGTLVDDVDETADIFGELIERFGWQHAPRRLGLKVNVGRQPTHDELVDAVRRIKLGIITLELTS